VSSQPLRIFSTSEDLFGAAAELVATLAQEAISQRRCFSVALAGGSTPRRLYELLASEPYRAKIDWRNCEVFWGDERAVPPEHSESNYKLASDSLLQQVPVDAAKVHRMRGEATDLERAALEYQREIATVFGVSATETPPPLDLVLLGIGEDGHTASLFPYTAAIRESERWIVANDVSQQKMHRLTMTLPIINRARHVLFLVVGESKAAVLEEILEGPPDFERLPTQAVRPDNGKLHWFVDFSAAARLHTQ
jgi:6-phosphogluconolactonase